MRIAIVIMLSLILQDVPRLSQTERVPNSLSASSSVNRAWFIIFPFTSLPPRFGGQFLRPHFRRDVGQRSRGDLGHAGGDPEYRGLAADTHWPRSTVLRPISVQMGHV